MKRKLPLALVVLALPALAAACADVSSADEGGDPATSSPAGKVHGDARVVDPAYLVPGDTRTFDVTYVGHVTEVPAGTKRLRVWLPVPQDTRLQTITDLRLDGPVEPVVHTEPTLGNKMAYFDIPNPEPQVDVTMKFTVARKEHLTDLAKLRAAGEGEATPTSRWLRSGKLEVVDDRIRKMAAEATAGKTSTLEKARAIYDVVLGHMTYDKSGVGWGRGDTVYACDVGKGNCTDFHAMFASLARAAGIPASFEIGLYVPYERNSKAALGGYHCWALFEVPGRTWVPIDISEADQHPERADYFFGNHTSNRVTLSVGRDVPLLPAQAGEPLNYFLVPHAEADGRAVPTSKDWTYQDR